MPNINHPADYAITVANDEDRTYYFDDQEALEDFARGLLVSEDTSRISPTDFKMYERAENSWYEIDFDPYVLSEDIDDTPFPLAHEQLFGNYSGEVDHKILWDIAQGDESAIRGASSLRLIALIPSASLRARVRNTYNALVEVNAWDEPEIDSYSDDFFVGGTWLFNSGQEVQKDRADANKPNSLFGYQIDEEETDGAWLTEI